MRIVFVLGAAMLLAGCVQQPYPLPPIELQPYPPPVSYQTSPAYRPPGPPPLAEPLPLLNGQNPDQNPAENPDDQTGPIPLQDMPAPGSETFTPTGGSTVPPSAAALPSVPSTPTAGPGSNVPLEGFRPMHGQSRPTP